MSETVEALTQQLKAERAERKRVMVETRRTIRRAVADYMRSEGCSCCRGDEHDEHKAKLAFLLNVPKYDDGSGFDFNQFATNPIKL